MGAYVLSLMVTLDQELAIQTLFTQKHWQFIRIDQSATDGCIKLVGKNVTDGNKDEASVGMDTSVTDSHGDTGLGIIVKEEVQSGGEEVGEVEEGLVDYDYDTEDVDETSITTQVNKSRKRKKKSKTSSNTDTNKRPLYDSEIGQTYKAEGEDDLQEEDDNLLALLEELPDIKHISELVTSKCSESDNDLPSGTPHDIDTDANSYISSLAVYYCKWCHYTFPELKHFEGHKRKGQCFFVCQFCEAKFTFRNFSSYQDHLREHRPLSPERSRSRKSPKATKPKLTSESPNVTRPELSSESPNTTSSEQTIETSNVNRLEQTIESPNMTRPEQTSESPNDSVKGLTGRRKRKIPKRETKTIEEKYSAIIECEKGVRTKRVIAREYDVPSSTLSTWLKNKDSIRKGYLKFGPNRKAMKTGNFDKLEEVLLKWVYFSFESSDIHVTGPMIQSKAEELASDMSIDDFRATNGWLDRFKFRHGILFRKVCGESNSVDTNV